MNGLYPERFDEADAERIDAAAEETDGEVRVALLEALSERRRERCQHEQLTRLNELTNAPVTTLPFLFKPELGVEQVRELARAVAA
jgi:hypothetical protein